MSSPLTLTGRDAIPAGSHLVRVHLEQDSRTGDASSAPTAITTALQSPVAGTKALRVEYRVKMGPARVRGTQVYLIPKDKLLVVTITQNDVEASSADANMIIDGLRVT